MSRRWGYFAMPILHHEHLIGKVDPTTDRDSNALVVHAIHQDRPWTRSTHSDVDVELQALADWLELPK